MVFLINTCLGMQSDIMSRERRRVELKKCEVCEECTVHCETANGEIRCELCGRIEDQILHRMM